MGHLPIAWKSGRLLIVLLLAAPAAAEAQGPPPTAAHTEKVRQVIQKLQSADPQTRAWGVYEAAAFHVREAGPALEAILSAPLPQQTDRERWALVDLALDSLIQLKARVPAALLAPYALLRPVQTHVLLSDATGRVPVLLDLLGQAKGLEWYAAANLLLRDKAPGLATDLLRNVRLQLVVTVSEGGDRISGLENMVGAGVGDGIGQNPKGFPPHAAYRFESAAWPGVVVLADGPRPVFYSRVVHTGFQFGVSQLHDGGPNDDDRLTYLQAMVDPFSRPTLRARTNEVVSWSTPAALLERVAQFRRDLERRFDGIRSRIEELYKLTGQTTRPVVEVQLVDMRKDRSVTLPTVPH